MKKRTFIMGLAALALAFGSAGVIGGVSLGADSGAIMTRAEDTEISRTITFGSKCTWNPSSKNLTYTEENDPKTSWSLAATFAKTASYSASSDTNGKYVQIGASNSDKNIKSLELTGVLPSEYVVTSVNIKVGGFSDTKGDISIKIDDVVVDTLSFSTTNLATLSSPSTGHSGNKIAFVFPSTTKRCKIYSITYTANLSSKPAVSIESGSDITLKNGGVKDVALTIKNLPEGGSVSVETGDSNIATASINDQTMTINGVAEGETTYTVSMIDSSGAEVASCSGKITVSAAVTDVTLSSTFADGDTLRIGTTYTLNTAVAPSAASQEIVWAVSDSDAVTISSENVLSVVKKTGTDAIIITASSAADSTKYATLSFYVSNDFAISELVSQDGSTLPNGLVKDSSVVATTGTVTAIEGTSVYIQSGTSAIELFTYGDELSSLKIGDGVRASGTITLFSGITELSSPTATVDETVKEDIKALELTKDDMVVANTSRLVTAHNAKCLTDQTVSGTSNIGVSFQLEDGTAFTLYIKKALISTVSSFGNFTKDSYYDIKGIYCLFKGTTNQIVIDEGCSYYAAGTEEVKQFIADYITGKDGAAAEGDTCKAKYDAAKAAYDKLSENAKTLFTTGSDYASAYATYTYWETHQNDASAAKLVNSSDTANWTNIAVIAGAVLFASFASAYFFLNKKKQDR